MFILPTLLFLLAFPGVDSGTADALFEQAQASLMHGDVDGALSSINQGLALAPNSVEGLNLLGIAYEQQNRFQDAESAFRKALRIAPGSVKTHDNLGASYLLHNQPALAEREFQASLRLNPDDASANYNMGKLLLENNEARAALSYLERVPTSNPAVTVVFVRALIRAGQEGRALAVAKTASASSPNDARVHFSLGMELAAGKQYEAAIHEFEMADVLVPNTFEVLHNLGEAYLRDGNRADAERALQQALVLHPDSASSLILMAQAEADEHKYIDALDLCRRAHSLQPDSPDVLLLLAQIARAEDLDENAVSFLREAIKFAPNRPDLHAALGESYLKLGRIENAMNEFKTVLRLRPSAEALAFIGEASTQSGDLEGAKKYLRQALAKEPHNAASLYQLGLIAGKEGRTHDAEALFAAAIKADPAYDNALYELATAKMHESKFAEAVPLLKRCAETMDVPRVYYRLATAERSLHDRAAAADAMQRFEAMSKLQRDENTLIRNRMDALSGATGSASRE